MIQKLFAGLLALGTIGMMSLSLAAPAGAAELFDDCKPGSENKVCAATEANTSVDSLVQRGVSLLMYAIGIVSVIMIVIGGFRYTTSNGDSNSITAAKNTILYAVVGLVVAIMGQAIVVFVVNWFS